MREVYLANAIENILPEHFNSNMYHIQVYDIEGYDLVILGEDEVSTATLKNLFLNKRDIPIGEKLDGVSFRYAVNSIEDYTTLKEYLENINFYNDMNISVHVDFNRYEQILDQYIFKDCLRYKKIILPSKYSKIVETYAEDINLTLEVDSNHVEHVKELVKEYDMIVSSRDTNRIFLSFYNVGEYSNFKEYMYCMSILFPYYENITISHLEIPHNRMNFLANLKRYGESLA